VIRTPVAFILFNRPQPTRRVFAEIRRAQPQTLLIIADGPRYPGERTLCKKARSVIEQIDWPCDVRLDISNENLGCRNRVSSGIDWVFEQVEEAIILEDDCLPHPTFFRFCDELLERYRDDPRVMQIGGSNAQFGRQPTSDSYYFSAINMIWGWATWRRAWKDHYDVTMSRWREARDTRLVKDLFGEQVAARIRTGFDNIYSGKTDSWDNQWTLALWLAGGLTALPSVNLISNIGFGPDATHTRKADSAVANLDIQAMEFPLKHPETIARNRAADDHSYRMMIQSKAA
jgi:hypothetical protein